MIASYRTLLPPLFLCASAAAQTTLVAHYQLNETSGTVAADSSGNGNDGVYTGAGVTLGQAGVCSNSTSVEFDGASGYVAIPSSPSLDSLSSDFTVASWANLDVLQLMRIFSNQRLGGVGGSWSYGPWNTAGGIRFTTLGIQDYNQPASLTTGVWHHIVLVFDANFQAHFYLDGALVGTVGGTSAAAPPNPGWFIAVLDLTGIMEYFDGKIDDVQVYSGSATAADILFLFQNPCSTLGTGAIGTSYCGPAIPNSSALPGVIEATGNVLIVNNDVMLTASQLPVGQFGYFLTGQTQGFFNPPGSQGIICLMGNIGRYNAVPQIIQGPTGSLQIDLTSIPVNPPQAVLPGDTWNFQCWFRDNNPGLTSNFTDGVSVTFM